ncbi:hypothetical protein FIU87_11725 [Bacillus sp. THAF10]|uniref:hypothetical protein n=1 Tax=Bacillus sp. THAF10 TaxID=2587848 RepID=UPI001268A166|nr:hypothetical protein [Bacillus sp. THAF10]QFT89320.1 hypothetical protein FIU87_11725 [Bacillus sp. THAF10]
MLRTHFQGREVIVRIKHCPLPQQITEEQVYQSLLAHLETIYQMELFAVISGEYMIVGETKQSAIPLITILSIVPVENIIR